MSTVPKKIWMFWLQGWGQATELSKLCLESWTKLNPTWEIIPITRDNISDYLDLDEITDYFYSKKPISCTVDILNLNLLKKYGGIWIDSTVLCLKPLDLWLSDSMDTGFFAFKFDPIPPLDEASGKTRLLGTWFIAANKDNYLIEQWCEHYNQYWLGRTEPTYYYDFHYLFYDLYHQDKKFKETFDNVPAKDADLMHLLSEFTHKPVTPALLDRAINGEFECVKYQNVYENNTYEGEQVIQKLYSTKHQNHLMQTSDISGLKHLYELMCDHYLN